MTLHTPVWMQPLAADPNINYAQAELRNMLQTLIDPAGAPNLRGVVSVGDYLVSQHAAGANFSVDVAAGRALIPDGDVSLGGTYHAWSDAVVNLTVPSPPVSGTENHRVVLQIRNKGENGTWTTYDFTPVLLADTGSGTPATPASAISLAIVSVAAGQANVSNSNITDTRTPALKRTVWKTALTTRSSMTATADPDLTMILDTGTWRFRAFLPFDGAATIDATFGWVVPASTSGAWGGSWHAGGSSAIDQHGHGNFTTLDSIVTNGSGTDSYEGTQVDGLLIITTVGQFALQWCAAHTGSVSLHTGAFLEAERIG